jgi:hypothetical protein
MSDSPAARLGSVTTWAAILTIVLLAEVRSVVATRTDGFTIDEAYHIAAGVSYPWLRTSILGTNRLHLKIGGRDHACAAAALFPHAHEADRGCR